MPSARKPSLILPVAIIVAVLLALYVGAYYWMVMPMLDGEADAPVIVPFYAIGDPTNLRWMRHERSLVAFFAPMHWIDRRIRPHAWDPREFGFE